VGIGGTGKTSAVVARRRVGSLRSGLGAGNNNVVGNGNQTVNNFGSPAVSYGNLKDRTLGLAQNIADSCQQRTEKWQNTSQRLPKPVPLDVTIKFTIGTDTLFNPKYWVDVVKLRDEYAGLNIRDHDLDTIVDGYKTNLEIRQAYPQVSRQSTCIGLPEIERIGKLLVGLTSQLK
jgi:hypothetical protein